ncbi:oxidoreductase [Methylobacterium sp. Leaf89]|uniref:oxidoreductase n=1 Tax=Methylobacterium sp. Leaf89 TaxID=1736245 RepID=UPI0006F97FED|nr:oxidoreductase [Methylobacterium sp. Leaf89]KQO68634.1 short-chain dehydrogenase [Methylobacterium sp. Leaf89]
MSQAIREQAVRKTAIVTGASSGIGLASVRALHKAGYRVFGTSRRSSAVLGDAGTLLTCDLTDEASVAAMVKVVLDETGRIDLLVNNAGFGISGGAEESSIAQAQDLFDVNLFGVIRAIRAVIPTMRAQKNGRIINISSVLGLIPAPYMALYAASKHAVEGYSESLDHEVRSQGIRVVLVEPAYTRTAFDQNLLVPDAQLDLYIEARAGADRTMRAAMVTADAPEIVADAVLAAAEASVPRRRYTAGKVARQISLLRRFAPAHLFDKSLRKQMQLTN